MIYGNYFMVSLYSVLSAITLNSVIALAHGGGGADAAKEKPKNTQVAKRTTPAVPTIVGYSELANIMGQQKSPGDVAIIRCTLNNFANCRGLEIALYDLKGNLIASANSGSEGVVGFEGLKEGQKYEARLETSKYKGSVVFAPGGAWMLNGDRNDN